MSDRMTVSVCMATYNGGRYLKAQLESILPQLHAGDEVVVVDDASHDDSVAVVESLESPFIRIHRNEENRGYVRTFERAMTLARGEVLLLADQDDIWPDGRVDALCAFADSRPIVASNLVLLDTGEPLRSPVTGRPWLLQETQDTQPVRNELRILLGDAPYFGCAMAVRRDALELVLPLPAYLSESHDLWIATVGNAAGLLKHLELPTVHRRVHESNASTSRPRGLVAALRSRVLLLRLWCEARRRSTRV